ncbi:F0F1 ATP synthase subunit A, partial [Streptomyces althioticus]
MSADPTQVLAFDTNCHLFDGCGFAEVSPGLHSFLFQPLWGDGDSNLYFNKTMLLALLGSVIIIGFFWAAFRRPQVVPGKLQMVAPRGSGDLSEAIITAARDMG